MKYFVLLMYAGIVMTIFVSCKKEPSKIINNSTSIIGKWELRQTVGNTPVKNYAQGNGSIYEFTDSGYSIFANGTLIKKGIYNTSFDSTASEVTGIVESHSGQFTNRIIFNNDTISNKIFYQISNNKLTFISGYFPLDGGFSSTYERQ